MEWHKYIILTWKCQRKLNLKVPPRGTKEQPETGVFWFPSPPRGDPLLQTYIHKYCRERAGLPGVPTHLWAQLRPSLLFKFLVEEGPSQSHQDTGTKDQLGTGSFWFVSAPQSWPCTTALHTQIPPGENWSPRILTHRLEGWTRYSQRQQDQLTPEITRWRKASTRI